ncbi:uncharacterized protein LOC130629293 isoform X1 [Hydractinia symbiolongicarpus]|uniref:uncharacterized protein LOC130629293 isoform X1 n=1 Tax=Hydractinia symbiolongicarpus TaxID=13093 RepID=UPI0025500858|nr:uncharacterized protein LOC130629293 isoform X1 [Hydractinia symbiolongicarpus]XP_057298428.1 uncharacterized protein LOC130629293 isoform X1 [Hydractinia symbiolongicarpus]
MRHLEKKRGSHDIVLELEKGRAEGEKLNDDFTQVKMCLGKNVSRQKRINNLTRSNTQKGIPMYFVALLLEMSDWGGTDAALLKNGIDSIFMEHGSIHLDPNTYTNKFVGCISDGASINFRATRTGCFNYL